MVIRGKSTNANAPHGQESLPCQSLPSHERIPEDQHVADEQMPTHGGSMLRTSIDSWQQEESAS